MIADVTITEKSFGPKSLMADVRFTVDEHEKVGVIGRNGIGKSTLFAILSGVDHDFTGEVNFKRGASLVSTAQDYHDFGDITALQYILRGIPEYPGLSRIIEEYPATMGDDLKLIEEYTVALDRFGQKGFYQIEEEVERELENFQLHDLAHRKLTTLSGGQKRLVEVVKIMHADADLVLVDEPTNHMDYVAKEQFIGWLKAAREAVLVITHDRDVLAEVDKIIELKDGGSLTYHGNYDSYLKQNTERTSVGMNDFEMISKRIANLKQKVIDYQRLKEKSRNPSTIQKFKRLENKSREELVELQKIEKPTFWIDQNSAATLDYRAAARYDKYKTKNIRLALHNDESRSKHKLVSLRDVSLGYDMPLFSGMNWDLYEGESIELRGRNGAGKSSLVRYILNTDDPKSPHKYAGEVIIDPQVRIGFYEQEVSTAYFKLSLHDAIERIYLDQKLSVSETVIRGLISDYLFSDGDMGVAVERLSGGQKARLQVIKMLSNKPQLLILDEPTNHLDLPSIEELESALLKYSGAILYISHDNYFRAKLGGEVIEIKVN